MPEVDLFHWNPRRRRSRLLPARVTKPVDNFGDLLGPIVTDEMRRLSGRGNAVADARLLSIGSVLHFAEPGDVVWGSGVNGKNLDRPVGSVQLDVRAVRGPRTREVLRAAGVEVPAVFGDPGVLVGRLWPRADLVRAGMRRPLSVVPNLHDVPAHRGQPGFVDPRAEVWDVVTRIANSDMVVGSSLHGIVVAESFGVPARLVLPGAEPAFKYLDYFEGTGREAPAFARTVAEAVEMGGEDAPVVDDSLMDSFPKDLWR